MILDAAVTPTAAQYMINLIQSITESCFNKKSSYYCPKTEFFKSIKPGSAANGMCYYYNATVTTVNEQALTNTQRSRLVSENAGVVPAAVSLLLF